MKKLLNRISVFLDNNTEKILIISLAIISVISFIFYFNQNQLNLAYGDAESRLNIARKVIDNLTPGFAQFGNIWLPLPQILMLPFVWSSFMWHTGIAGYIMSGIGFIFLIYFLYKTGELAFDSKTVGILTALAGLNINLIYMQTTAMSEVIFITFVTGATYYLLKWAKTDHVLSLMFSGAFVSAASFSRYEGYFVFFASIFLVVIVGFLKYKNLKKLEGFTVLFGTIAITGIVVWAIYSLAIFKDPFYWKGIYSGQNSIISTDISTKKVITDDGNNINKPKNLVSITTTVWESGAWMNGLILTTVASAGIGIFIVEGVMKRWLVKKPYMLILLLPISAVLFVTFSLFSGGPPLVLPIINWHNLFDKNVSNTAEYNIRYGMNMLPVVAVFVGYLATKGKIGKFFASFIILAQLLTTFWTPLSTIYQLPVKLAGTDSSSADNGQGQASDWLKNNYDNGLIMISALKHDPEMFYMGFDYKTYIHEGSGKYWLTSRDNPQKYATWIFMYKPSANTGNDSDSVTKYIANNLNLNKYFNIAYQDKTFIIYKIKTQPEIQIKN